MWFLIKGTFWFSMVLVLLSYFGTRPEAQDAGASLDVADAISAATDAYAYVSEICSVKPDVCVKGAETFAALGERAREGALVAYQLLDRQFGDEAKSEDAATADAISDVIVTGTVNTSEGAVPTPRPKPAT
ncbi:DUF5330 domain-containing protein [Ciceribacter ferrooxidans]|uniref:DUF5330 domain-containing protein n=1 Tax=Ciceribacter ferrooxidans TaxID=2509717 RepID=A0A4Q2U0S5_9HYPH|nr:DUF5330 domain-containing protein [Ciceribacter ferrooxidans]RYC26825.1 hypothetical protein EUU22_01195 [Ciceribacter ferrooxidans]